MQACMQLQSRGDCCRKIVFKAVRQPSKYRVAYLLPLDGSCVGLGGLVGGGLVGGGLVGGGGL